MLETFDLPQMNPNCAPGRGSTLVSQPLFLLNNRTVHELAAALAKATVHNQRVLVIFAAEDDDLARQWKRNTHSSDKGRFATRQRSNINQCIRSIPTLRAIERPR